MDLFFRPRRAQTDTDAAIDVASYWMRRYLDVLNLLADRRARMKDMAAEIRSQRLEITTLREKLGAAGMLPLHELCGHSEAIHDVWGCTLCECMFTPWLSVAGVRPSKVTPADEVTAVWPPIEGDWPALPIEATAQLSGPWAEAAEIAANDDTVTIRVDEQGYALWSPAEEAASWLADDDSQRRRADR